MLPNDANSKSEVLSLERIALWYDGTTVDERSPCKIDREKKNLVRAGVPILQRGLVWRPHQVEMFWDSLLRGFPVGSLVLCPKIKDQTKKSDDDVTHHLLDGQQRCDAIRLGFTDPFPANGSEDHLASVLWLDLNPDPPDNTTREYFARLTTSAHPWGYRNNDGAERMIAAEMRKARSDGGHAAKMDQGRPSPRALSPYFSRAPVPLAWLTAADVQAAGKLRERLLHRLEDIGSNCLNWPAKTIEFLKNDGAAEQKLEVVIGALVRAKGTTVVALMVPAALFVDETVRESRDRNLGNAQTQGGISSIEHLFQRLNRVRITNRVFSAA